MVRKRRNRRSSSESIDQPSLVCESSNDVDPMDVCDSTVPDTNPLQQTSSDSENDQNDNFVATIDFDALKGGSVNSIDSTSDKTAISSNKSEKSISSRVRNELESVEDNSQSDEDKVESNGVVLAEAKPSIKLVSLDRLLAKPSTSTADTSKNTNKRSSQKSTMEVDSSSSSSSESSKSSSTDEYVVPKTRRKSLRKPVRRVIQRKRKRKTSSSEESSAEDSDITEASVSSFVGTPDHEVPKNIHDARVSIKLLPKDANLLLDRFKLREIRNARNRIIASKDAIPENESDDRQESENDDDNLLIPQNRENSSDSNASNSDDDIATKKSKRRIKTRKQNSSVDDSDAFISTRAKSKKPAQRTTRSRVKVNISDDSGDSAGETLNMRKKNTPKSSADATDSNSDTNDSNSEEEFKQPKKDYVDSDDDFQPAKRRRVIRSTAAKKSQQSDNDDDDDDDDDDETYNGNTKTKSKRRKRIKKNADSSDEDKDSPKKSGRKNIRKVIRTEDLEEETKEAAKREGERKKRIEERQKLYNSMYDSKLEEIGDIEKLVLDFDEDTMEELLSVDKKLVKKLKPHQAQGVKFMWDACFESIDKINENSGGGCILAHCMGLGKTLQVVTLVHTLLTHSDKTGVEKVLVICPVSTVLNWVNEFKIWLRACKHNRDIDIYEISKYKQNNERAHYINEWHNDGGVLIMGYDMFRNLSGDATRIRKKQRDIFQAGLLDPGADLVVCDEGHLLKNAKTSLSKAVNKIRTLRRIVLTGTPLQNNLNEYYCMVQFVKPNLLGKYNEYLNRFVNPITNGQYTDSTHHDTQMMKRRSHILHKLLDGCVQRKDYSVLSPYLPPKQEYVLYIRLTEIQVNLYKYYMANKPAQNELGKTRSSILFQDFQNLQRIWTHPRVLRYNSDRYELIAQKKKFMASDEDEVGSLKDFLDDDDDLDSDDSNTSSSSSNGSSVQSVHSEKPSNSKKIVTARRTRAMAKDSEEPEEEIEPIKEENPTEWWMSLVPEDELNNVEHSGKLMLLFSLLAECEAIGDKLLVFSQSLFSLDVIEHFLSMIDDNTQNPNPEAKLGGFGGNWSKGIDYFRLDGSTNIETRNANCISFNSEDNLRARLFLISTRAGGLGINLVAANRVIIFDASWNPSHDIQSIFRVYRFGQKKPCYIYRFIAMGTMEEKIYERQVTKLAISKRVIDEHQIDRHYKENDLNELYNIENIDPQEERPQPILPKDRLFAEQLVKYSDRVWKYHEHDSLLENKAEETLSKEEIDAAWKDYEEEKNRPTVQTTYVGYPAVQRMPGSGPVTSNTIFGFRTDILLQLLNIKARRTYPGTTNISSLVPMLLRHLYETMQNNDTTFYQELLHIQATEMATQSTPIYLHHTGSMPTYSGRGRPPLSAQHNAQMQHQQMITQAQNRLIMQNGATRLPAPSASSQIIEID